MPLEEVLLPWEVDFVNGPTKITANKFDDVFFLNKISKSSKAKL